MLRRPAGDEGAVGFATPFSGRVRSGVLAGIGFLVVASVGCGDGGGGQNSTERQWDVVGIVESASLGSEFDPPDALFTRGERYVTPGESTISLEDGTELEVPLGTPGGNLCLEFLSDADLEALTGHPAPSGNPSTTIDRSAGLSPRCVVIADVEERSVRRFEILESTDDGLAVVGDLVEGDEDGYLTTSGYRFAAAENVVVECEIGERPALEDFTDEDIFGEAYVDTAQDLIVEIHCLYDG